jgi:hypothetical protein
MEIQCAFWEGGTNFIFIQYELYPGQNRDLVRRAEECQSKGRGHVHMDTDVIRIVLRCSSNVIQFVNKEIAHS